MGGLEPRFLEAHEDGFPVPAVEIMRHFAIHPFADVTVDIGGIHVDVCDVIFDERRDKYVLKVLPEDLEDGHGSTAGITPPHGGC